MSDLNTWGASSATFKSQPQQYKTPIWRRLMYRRLAKARSSDFVERALMKVRRR